MTTTAPAPPEGSARAAAVALGAATLALGMLALWPIPLALDTTVVDTRFTNGHLVAFGIGTDLRTLWQGTGLLGWPVHAAFTPLLWPGLLMSALLGPVTALNLSVLLLPAVNAASGWWLGRALGLRVWARASVGALLAWNPWVHNAMANGQFELAVIGAAACVWATGLWCARGDWRRVPIAGLAVTATACAAPYPAAAGAACLGGAWVAETFLEWWGARRKPSTAPPPSQRPSMGRVVPTLLAVVTGLALAQGWHAAAFASGTTTFAPRGADQEGDPIVATLAGLLRPPQVDPGAYDLVHCTYLGWTWALGAGFTLLAARWRPAFAVPLAGPFAAAGLGAVLALGASTTVGGVRWLLPMSALMAMSDTVARNANPYRFLIGTIVALSVLAATRASTPRRAVLLVALAWTETVVTRTRPIPLPARPVGEEPMARILAEAGPSEKVVLDLPPGVTSCASADHYAVQAAVVHGRPVPVTIRHGWKAYGEAAPVVRALWRTLRAPGCDARLPALLDGLPLSAIVAHQHGPCGVEPAALDCLTSLLGPPVVTEDGAVWIDPAVPGRDEPEPSTPR